MTLSRRLLGFAWAFVATTAAAAPQFPALDGPVTDPAGVLGAEFERSLAGRLVEYEKTTTNQIAVAALPDLQGYTIEDFGYQLGRHWGLGQKGRDNGVLLLIAVAERKVRIEVGYGLEGAITDALASNIIRGVIVPQFRTGDFEQGVADGVDAIMNAAAGEFTARPAQPAEERHNRLWLIVLLVVVLWQFVGPLLPFSRRFRRRGRGVFVGGFGGGFGGGRGGGGGFGGGFSGGGGSFGGGGASGGW